MASIMCAQPLWRALLNPASQSRRRRKAPAAEPVFQHVLFGPWAGTLARFDGRELVIMLDAAAYLTVVFRLRSRDLFRRDFSTALAHALEDLGTPARTIALETCVIDALPLVRLGDRQFSRALQHVTWFCDLELGYHADLRRVTRNLNELPHGDRDPCVPAQAVATLVGRATGDADPPSH